MPNLATTGEALFGPRWQTPLAEALGVSDRTVRRWAAGHPIPLGVWPDIAALCRDRGAVLVQTARVIESATKPSAAVSVTCIVTGDSTINGPA